MHRFVFLLRKHLLLYIALMKFFLPFASICSTLTQYSPNINITKNPSLKRSSILLMQYLEDITTSIIDWINVKILFALPAADIFFPFFLPSRVYCGNVCIFSPKIFIRRTLSLHFPYPSAIITGIQDSRKSRLSLFLGFSFIQGRRKLRGRESVGI